MKLCAKRTTKTRKPPPNSPLDKRVEGAKKAETNSKKSSLPNPRGDENGKEISICLGERRV